VNLLPSYENLLTVYQEYQSLPSFVGLDSSSHLIPSLGTHPLHQKNQSPQYLKSLMILMTINLLRVHPTIFTSQFQALKSRCKMRQKGGIAGYTAVEVE
jgi:hypothetical protein